ncbi:MlaD family protein [Rhodohalobacter sulfatireducens]|uniref:MlaD family protein n=1 Tax=Rhodohalobacter sulfatireducens TaxID=2911366 RepID=A0ABS9KAL2_9BACT|nr:MlaD family protein [Rhodohalobacter sulfatireducens]MCG2587868.1 MlaD family protein [Rhodohalobacter sulfatireducens]
MKLSNEAKVGITVFLAVVVAIIGFRFMRDVPIFGTSLNISSTFEKADGISNGSLVYIKGVRVGSVNSVQLTPENNVQVGMSIDTDVNIPEDSRANLTSLGIVEGKSIVIEMGSSSQFVETGDEIAGTYAQTIMETLGDQGEQLGSDVSNSINELNQFLRQLNETVDDETRGKLDETLSNLLDSSERVANLLEEKRGDIDLAIESGSRVISQLDTLATNNRPKVDSLMTSLEENVRELSVVREELETASASLNQLLDKLNNGEGTMGKLINDPSVYENLDSLTIELNKLVKGINEDPGKYLKHMSIIEVF